MKETLRRINAAHWVNELSYCEKFDNTTNNTGFMIKIYRDINPYSITFNKTLRQKVESDSCPIDSNPDWVEVPAIVCQRYIDDPSYSADTRILNYNTGYRIVQYKNVNPNYQGSQYSTELEYDEVSCPIDTNPLWVYDGVYVNDEKRTVTIYYDTDECGNKDACSAYAIKRDVNQASDSYGEEISVPLYINETFVRPCDSMDIDDYSILPSKCGSSVPVTIHSAILYYGFSDSVITDDDKLMKLNQVTVTATTVTSSLNNLYASKSVITIGYCDSDMTINSIISVNQEPWLKYFGNPQKVIINGKTYSFIEMSTTLAMEINFSINFTYKK